MALFPVFRKPEVSLGDKASTRLAKETWQDLVKKKNKTKHFRAVKLKLCTKRKKISSLDHTFQSQFSYFARMEGERDKKDLQFW